MVRRKRRRDSMARAAMDVGVGGAAWGFGTDIVGRVPGGAAGASAMAMGAGFMPVYSTARVGGVVIGEARKLGGKKRRKNRSWL